MNNAREKNMIGLYFSGTGNSKYAVETFLQAYEPGARAYAIEDKRAIEELSKQEEIVFGYSVQYSSEPKLLYDFIEENARVWKKKKVFVIATMCYRCVNHCPKQAITILGRQVVTQSTIEKYIK